MPDCLKQFSRQSGAVLSEEKMSSENEGGQDGF